MNVRPAKGARGWTIRERNGYLLLCSLLFVPLTTEFLFRYFNQERIPIHQPIEYREPKRIIGDTSPVSISKKTVPVSKRWSTTKVDINTADSIALVKVNGIGPILAGRIIKYRTLLGGYVSKEQLREVYGLKEEFYSNIQSQVIVTKTEKGKISVDSILRNPYSVYHPYWSKASKKELILAKKRGLSEDSLIQMVYSNQNKNWKEYLNK